MLVMSRVAVGFRRKDEDQFECQVPIPGIAPDTLEVESQGRVVRLRIANREGEEVRLPLPESADTEALTAEYAHGMLTLRAPIRSQYRARQIPVMVG